MTLSGKVATRSMIPLLVMTARSVDGVVDAVNMLGYPIAMPCPSRCHGCVTGFRFSAR